MKLSNGNLIIAKEVEMNECVIVHESNDHEKRFYRYIMKDIWPCVSYNQVVFIVCYIDYVEGFYYGITPTEIGWNNCEEDKKIA